MTNDLVKDSLILLHQKICSSNLRKYNLLSTIQIIEDMLAGGSILSVVVPYKTKLFVPESSL